MHFLLDVKIEKKKKNNTMKVNVWLYFFFMDVFFMIKLQRIKKNLIF